MEFEKVFELFQFQYVKVEYTADKENYALADDERLPGQVPQSFEY